MQYHYLTPLERKRLADRRAANPNAPLTDKELDSPASRRRGRGQGGDRRHGAASRA